MDAYFINSLIIESSCDGLVRKGSVLGNGKTYVANFCFDDPISEVSDFEYILIINAESGAIGGVLSAEMKDFKKFLIWGRRSRRVHVF